MSRRADGTLHGTYYDKACTQCGSKFSTRKPAAKYCSYRCVNLARYDRVGRTGKAGRIRSRRIFPRDCDLCRKLFIARRAGVQLCPNCRDTAKACRVFITECSACSKLFTSRYTRRTCSPACGEAAQSLAKREAKLKRRAIKRDAFVSNVSPRMVFERDGWKCHLCGRKIDRKAQVPSPKAATVDHVIPLAAGGTHEPLNCRAAHFICNSTKGSRGGGEQLLLVA